jgi:zinc protease
MLYQPRAMSKPVSDALYAAAEQAQIASGHTVRLTQAHHFADGRSAARYALNNGLQIVLLADDRAPVFAYQTWFKVGSKDEDPERTGLAHLFEHLMFKGTARFATGTFDREMERRGAQTNAATWVDWTYYTEALAARADNLDTVIAFESDRMVNLQLDAATFRSELEVVKNERRMAVEDALSGTLGEKLMALAYQAHPYRWPTIGSMAHLDAATLADLERFYRAYYAPNNATVVIVGAIDLVQTLGQLAAAYGPLVAQPLQHRALPPEPRQTQGRQETIYRPLLAPQMVLGFHAPAQHTDDFLALEMLCDTLVAGETGRLYARLVTGEKIATEVSGYVLPFAEPGLLELHITAHPDADPAHIVRVVQEELDGLSRGLTPAEREKACNGLELGVYETLRDVEGCAEAMGHHQTTEGDFTRAFSVAERYRAVTDADLQRVAADVLRRTNRSVVLALPQAAAPHTEATR